MRLPLVLGTDTGRNAHGVPWAHLLKETKRIHRRWEAKARAILRDVQAAYRLGHKSRVRKELLQQLDERIAQLLR